MTLRGKEGQNFQIFPPPPSFLYLYSLELNIFTLIKDFEIFGLSPPPENNAGQAQFYYLVTKHEVKRGGKRGSKDKKILELNVTWDFSRKNMEWGYFVKVLFITENYSAVF